MNNLSDNDSQSQPVADSDGHSLPETDNGSQGPSRGDNATPRVDVERKAELHTLTVVEVVKLFDRSGVPRSQRSIARWCRPNAQGERRLDAFLDSASGKYFITPESVERVVEEERAKEMPSRGGRYEPQDPGLHHESAGGEPGDDPWGGGGDLNLERENKQLQKKLLNAELIIEANEKLMVRMDEQMKSQTQFFAEKLEALARENGMLETRLRQLEGPKQPEAGTTILEGESAEEPESRWRR